MFCTKWCEKNEYELILITDEWFIENFNKNKQLLENQPDGENILKKLKKFNEN